MNFLQLVSFANIHHGDENLDSIIEIQGLNGAFPRTFIITTMKREIIPSESKTETISKIYGDKHCKTIKQNGKIIREYGNATINELDQVYSSSNDNNDPAIICENRRSDFFCQTFFLNKIFLFK
ncbi:unnamed protein product [Rotaria sp. Silwood1]|nr:unnamed protein product [Rotaria sp. Silwood1]CAF4751913.1 unnamed protein product [Rotaria sp. Silwood1]CAF4774777.1 unnamed protein product [Rotaria sp. Silwood1]CAF4774795.1 unnamed protein product [Rotaria sp. Silwood1]